MAELRKLATHCQFGEFLDEALRDHLVSGLRAPSIQKRLDLSCADAMKLAQSMESAHHSCKEMILQVLFQGLIMLQGSREELPANHQARKTVAEGNHVIVVGVNIFPALADLKKLCVISARRKVIWQEYAGLVPRTRQQGRPHWSALSKPSTVGQD